MRIVVPFDVTSASLDSSNVPETPPAAYNAGTTYADGDLVSVIQGDGFTYKVYESLVGSNTGNAVTDPDFWLYRAETYAEYNAGTTYDVDDIVISTATHRAYQALTNGESGNSLSNAAKWLDLGPTNRYKMFDQSNTSQTENGESINVTIDVTGRANSVSFLNIVGETLQLIMTTDEDGEIYNETVNLISSNDVSDWWEYFFLPVSRYGDWTFSDLPTNNNPTVQGILTDSGSAAKIGSMVIGLSRYVGDVIYPSTIGIQDFSRIETDDFGNRSIIQRDFAKRANLKVAVEENTVDAISAYLSALRATPVVFIGVEQYRSTWIYGFYKDWNWQFAGPNEAYLNFELEGLT